MYIPRYSTLGEELYNRIENSEYLKKIHFSLLFNYSCRVMQIPLPPKEINVKDALRFADLLSKSIDLPNSEKHRMQGQELIILLSILYPDSTVVKYYLASVLSAVGNYRGIQTSNVTEYAVHDVMDEIFYEYERELLRIPDTKNDFFFHDQKNVYDSLQDHFFSYSGPTSMGKSFVVQIYIKQQIQAGHKRNFAIAVPTKALINEVRRNLLESLEGRLVQHNYRIISSSGDILINGQHNFIFVMTPERLLHLLIDKPNINIDFLFIDEAHKISERGGRSVYYYKVISQLNRRKNQPTIVFASPNIPNPEVYLNIIPDIKGEQIRKLASTYSPVCQFKFYLDMVNQQIYVYNSAVKELEFISELPANVSFEQLIELYGTGKQNLIYCCSKQKVVDLAVEYARQLPISSDQRLIDLANDVKDEVHDACYLVELLKKGVAYHVGYLPANIRLRIEKSFADGIIRTIFCTSTLVEGVNLPADNLFVTSYRNGISNMNEVEFNNLIGRVGRIKYNLYGNVFLIRMQERDTDKRYRELLKTGIPSQEVSINIPHNSKLISSVLDGLLQGDIELNACHKGASSEQDYDAMRKFALAFTRDLATDSTSPITQTFKDKIDKTTVDAIKRQYPTEKTSDDITFSFDQIENLRTAIRAGLAYPDVDYNALIDFMRKLYAVFKWDVYERSTLGKGESIIWYVNILMKWISGHGLGMILNSSLFYKQRNPESGVWLDGNKIADFYDDSKLHKNYVIAETLGVIENVILFKISNYFRKFSLVYQELHPDDGDFKDWYQYVEYGTTNHTTIFLQQCGLSRDVACYLQRKKELLVISASGDIKIKKAAMECGRIDVEEETRELIYNIPELFVE